jgi:hypothetical protein
MKWCGLIQTAWAKSRFVIRAHGMFWIGGFFAGRLG